MCQWNTNDMHGIQMIYILTLVEMSSDFDDQTFFVRDTVSKITDNGGLQSMIVTQNERNIFEGLTEKICD